MIYNIYVQYYGIFITSYDMYYQNDILSFDTVSLSPYLTHTLNFFMYIVI